MSSDKRFFQIPGYDAGKSDILTIEFDLEKFVDKYACSSSDHDLLTNMMIQRGVKNNATSKLVSLTMISSVLKTKRRGGFTSNGIEWLVCKLVHNLDVSDDDRIRIAILGFELVRNPVTYCKILIGFGNMDIPELLFIALAVIMRDDISYFVEHWDYLRFTGEDIHYVVSQYLMTKPKYQDLIRMIRQSNSFSEYVINNPNVLPEKVWRRLFTRMIRFNKPVIVNTIKPASAGLECIYKVNTDRYGKSRYASSHILHKTIILACCEMDYPTFCNIAQ